MPCLPTEVRPFFYIMRYFIYLSYDGTAYHGWQIQPNAASVQAELNSALSLLLREEVLTTGAGRTDTGVHARMMVAHFDTSAEIGNGGDGLADLCHKLNRILPPDISVEQIKPVPSDAHARFDAVARTYHYYIYQKKNPFRLHYAARFAFPLDFRKMNQAAEMLLSVRDFTSFSKVHTDTKTNDCNVSRAVWEEVEPGLWRFEITADRFLRNMVRAIVGTLIDVGRGKISLQQFGEIISQKDRQAASDSVPANALFLVDIAY